ncbi:hypothetical protein GCM10011512_28500 [Tersicoccus solisilvae]|uniref:DUF2505 domain-containing protein n=1 Tax=Tersicoccus solisilvae TaxID=1882339 RepID=A0ABQ1PN44_9MICC|nr:DUF2505 domain-containing protein [Tersicoccus solisilvae]GGC99911.1 hypothetical protein GCM10011512_28500 [Tersicoccus solisilvae]
MSLTATATIDAPVETVVAAFADRGFQEYAGNAAGGSLEDFRLDGESAGAFTVVITRAVSEEKIPDIARTMVRGRLLLTQEERWQAPAADGRRTADVAIGFGSLPLRVSGTETLAPAGENTTTLTITGEVTSSIPFLGGRIAALAQPAIAKAVQLQADAVARWLREH